jgi:ketosteroid isomerase-like protein
MTKWMFVLLSATALWAATPDSKTEKEVLAALEAYKQAMLKKDTAALNKLLTDDLTYTHSNNLHEDKAAVLAAIKTSAIEAIDFRDIKIRVYGNTALLVADADFRNNTAGTVSVSKLNILHVFVKGNSGWQLAARQATRYPDPAPAGKK